MARLLRSGYCPTERPIEEEKEEGVNKKVGGERERTQLAEALYKQHAHLVEQVWAQMQRGGLQADREEMLACGRQGLWEAALRFNPEKAEQFRSYAYLRVRGAMVDGLRRMGPWSRRAYERVVLERAAQAVSEGWQEEPRESATEQPPEAAERRLRNHLAEMATALSLGIFALRSREGEARAAPERELRTDELVERRRLWGQVSDALGQLPEVEREVVRRFYLEEQGLREVATALGVSESWVSRLHLRAVRRLGTRLRHLAG